MAWSNKDTLTALSRSYKKFSQIPNAHQTINNNIKNDSIDKKKYHPISDNGFRIKSLQAAVSKQKQKLII